MKLIKEVNPSKLIQDLLKRYYGELDKKVDEQKTEILKTESINTNEQ